MKRSQLSDPFHHSESKDHHLLYLQQLILALHGVNVCFRKHHRATHRKLARYMHAYICPVPHTHTPSQI